MEFFGTVCFEIMFFPLVSDVYDMCYWAHFETSPIISQKFNVKWTIKSKDIKVLVAFC